jgi:CHASE3 domain sensor protein
MIIKKDYNKLTHKIAKEWDDIATLIAMEEELFRRIESLEQRMAAMWTSINNTIGE